MLEGWLQCFTLIRWTHRPGYCIWCHASKNRLKPHSRLSVTGDWFSLMMQDGVSKVSSARVIRQHISLQMYSLWFVRKKVGANNVQCFITTRVKATTKGAAGIQSPPPVPPATPSPQRWRGEERRGEERRGEERRAEERRVRSLSFLACCLWAVYCSWRSFQPVVKQLQALQRPHLSLPRCNLSSLPELPIFRIVITFYWFDLLVFLSFLFFSFHHGNQ